MKQIGKKEQADWRVFINGKLAGIEVTPKMAVAAIIATSMCDLSLMSFDGLKHFTLECLEMLHETHDRSWPLLTKSAARMFNNKDQDREKVLTFLTNILLSAENLPPLKGFGMGTFEKTKTGSMRRVGKMFLDPERKRIS